jgi:hypothetical protein
MNSDKPRAEWIDLINESVHTSDDMDIGDIEAVKILLKGNMSETKSQIRIITILKTFPITVRRTCHCR